MQLQARADAEWLSARCVDPVFFAHMLRQHPTVCTDALSAKPRATPLATALLACLPSTDDSTARVAMWAASAACIVASVYLLPAWREWQFRHKTLSLCSSTVGRTYSSHC